MTLSRDRVRAVSRAALAEVAQLTGKDTEQIVALRREGADWVLDVDVVELRRIPGTTDFMATYRVRLDDAGEVLDLHRVRRYVRGWVGDED
ncbi:gas vesicle protein GvpO [Actinomycetospora chibensis]|uniref:Gas vesicle protein GvpO n=1 Tax=Actinomycetospora chibensis TaxID=663606 RepID=A0ABV9RDD9_9PSEU|nr:gas vesicle protein GvpO [Actinomycetospora chibensis]MDD7922166.1 gas vesicle protein [Actinomycetospora chibensis]